MSGPELPLPAVVSLLPDRYGNVQPGQDAQLPGHHRGRDGRVRHASTSFRQTCARRLRGRGGAAGTYSTPHTLYFPAPSFGSGSNLFAS